MFRIALVQMPFASIELPSLALTQLKAVSDQRLHGRASATVFYFNYEFAREIGISLYHRIGQADSFYTRTGEIAGLGEWFFRQSAFPWLEDNWHEYTARFFESPQSHRLRSLDTVQLQSEKASRLLADLIDRHGLDDYDLVGLGSMFAQNNACFALARLLKERTDPPVVVMGGANCEGVMGRAIAKHVSCIDAVFSGSSLVSFPAFAETLLEKGMVSDFGGKNIFLGSSVGSRTPPRGKPEAGNLNALAAKGVGLPLELDYDEFLETVGNAIPTPTITFETSTGCWWGDKSHCTFCGLNGETMSHRAMTPERALAQFRALFKYTDRCLNFFCVDNIMPSNYPQDVFGHVNAPPGVTIYYEVKPNLTEEDMRMLSRAHVHIVQPGIETLSTSMLRSLRKGATAFTNLRFLRNCLVAGVMPLWNYLIGIPGQTEADAEYEKCERDMRILRHLPPPSGVFRIRIDRFSPYHTRAGEYGLKLRPLAFYRFVYPFSLDVLSDLAYYFEDTDNSAHYLKLSGHWHARLLEEVKRWRDAFWNADDELRASLYIESDTNGIQHVYDTRTGTLVKYMIDEDHISVLRELEKPTRREVLTNKLGRENSGKADEVLYGLEDKGLVFREDDKFVSLVFFGDPAKERPADSIFDRPDKYKGWGLPRRRYEGGN